LPWRPRGRGYGARPPSRRSWWRRRPPRTLRSTSRGSDTSIRPAGAGHDVEVTVAGQFLEGVESGFVSGPAFGRRWSSTSDRPRRRRPSACATAFRSSRRGPLHRLDPPRRHPARPGLHPRGRRPSAPRHPPVLRRNGRRKLRKSAPSCTPSRIGQPPSSPRSSASELRWPSMPFPGAGTSACGRRAVCQPLVFMWNRFPRSSRGPPT